MPERSIGARLRAEPAQARVAVDRDRDRRRTRRTVRDHLQIAAATVDRNNDLAEAATVDRNKDLAEAVTVDRNKDLAEAANARHSHSHCRIRSFRSLAVPSVCTPGGTRRVRRNRVPGHRISLARDGRLRRIAASSLGTTMSFPECHLPRVIAHRALKRSSAR